jgi:hypothetical protein
MAAGKVPCSAAGASRSRMAGMPSTDVAAVAAVATMAAATVGCRMTAAMSTTMTTTMTATMTAATPCLGQGRRARHNAESEADNADAYGKSRHDLLPGSAAEPTSANRASSAEQRTL